MKIVKKVIVSILLVMIIISSIIPSSYGLTNQQQFDCKMYVEDYVMKYGGNGSVAKSRYSQTYRNSIYTFDYTNNVNTMSTPDRSLVYSDCSSFVSFALYKMFGISQLSSPWSTSTFDGYINKRKEDGKLFYYVGTWAEAKSQLQIGDVLIEDTNYFSGYSYNHAMLYIGNNRIAHNGSTDANLEIKPINAWRENHITYVLRLNNVPESFVLNSITGTTSSSYTPGDTDDPNPHDPASGDVDPTETTPRPYVDPVTGEDLGLDDDDFQYYGLPKVVDIETNKPWVIPKLSDIIDYLVGLAILFPKMAFVGWAEIVEAGISTSLDAVSGGEVDIFKFIMDSSKNVTIENIVYNRVPILDVDVFNMQALTQYTGTGADNTEGESRDTQLYNIIKTIKGQIAIWYYTFRNLVIIAMLVVLIYIGIKMAISTVAEERAKYKSIFTAWVVSFIIVIGIHYFMVLIMQLNNEMINLIIPKSIKGQEISLYETVRSRAYELKASRAIVGTILYLALIWYTLRFLVIYAKRFLSIMLLILMAPFASASFAINKIKDGKTPMFDNWMKEYTFNVIIQGIHAILYTFFVTLALNIANESLAGIILAFILIKFMVQSDKIVRKIFKLRSGSKYSSLDNNLSAGDDLANFVSSGGVMGMFTSSTLAKAYMNKWVKPMYGKYFGFAKGVLNVPYQAGKAGVVTAARGHMDGNKYNPNSKLNPFINAIASTSLLNERHAILDKYGEKIMGADGKPLYTESINWQKRGFFMLADGKLKYMEVTTSTRPVQSDIDKVIAMERARIRNENKKNAKAILSIGGNMVKGYAAFALGIPLLIDSPMIGLNLFLRSYSNLSPLYTNKRKAKIKGYRKPVKAKKYAFKDFGDGIKSKLEYISRHPFKTMGRTVAFATGASMYTKIVENASYNIEDMLDKSKNNAYQIEVLYGIRETEANIIEESKDLVTSVNSITDTSKINAVLGDIDSAMQDFAKDIYDKKIYKALDKNIKGNIKDFRMKKELRSFAIAYAKSHNMNIDTNGIERKVQEAIRKSDPKFSGHMSFTTIDLTTIRGREVATMAREIRKAAGISDKSNFEQVLKDKLNKMKQNGQTKVTETELIDITTEIMNNMKTKNIRRNLRQINPKISNKTKTEEFELNLSDTASIEKVKEELRSTYGSELGRKFEDNLDTLLEQKRNNSETVIKEKDLQKFIGDELKEQQTAVKSMFTADDIDGMKAEIDNFMLANGINVKFDNELEQKIKDKINSKTEETAVKVGDRYLKRKVITIQELEDVLHETIEQRDKPDESPILTKEEVVELVDMIQERNTDKRVTFGKEFEGHIEKLMQEEIVRSTIEEHVKGKYGDFTDEISVGNLERKINAELSANGYGLDSQSIANGYTSKVEEVLDTRDIISELQDTLKENLETEIKNKDMKTPKADVARMSDIVSDALRLEDSIDRKSPYRAVKEDIDPAEAKVLDDKAEKLADNIEKLRALNFKAEKLGVKRTEVNGKKINEEKLTKDELKEQQKVVDLNNLISTIWQNAKK